MSEKQHNKRGQSLSSTTCNYSKNDLDLQEIKRLNFWLFLEHLGGKFAKKKSTKYGKLFKWNNAKFWIRYDYKTGLYFYVNLTGADKGTLIDFIQEHITKEYNLGKVRKFIKRHLYLFF